MLPNIFKLCFLLSISRSKIKFNKKKLHCCLIFQVKETNGTELKSSCHGLQKRFTKIHARNNEEKYQRKRGSERPDDQDGGPDGRHGRGKRELATENRQAEETIKRYGSE